jgi:hypothetical protein
MRQAGSIDETPDERMRRIRYATAELAAQPVRSEWIAALNREYAAKDQLKAAPHAS